MNAKEIRELSLNEIKKKTHDDQNELVGLRIRKQVGQVENTSKIRSLRREIARLKTILVQKERAELATV